MATFDEAEQAVIDSIAAGAAATKSASYLLKYAEALAWIQSPAQPHGGSTSVSSK